MTDKNFGDKHGRWIGIVVNVNDPQKSGRVQIRVKGRHDDTANIPDASLPWALVEQSVTSAAIGGIGTAPVGLVKGSIVTGWWGDDDHQIPIVSAALGKAGNAVAGQTERGAPKVDTDYASVPASSRGIANNPYTSLYTGRVSVSTIDSQGANSSVKIGTGAVMTKEVEKSMRYASLPTIASASRYDKSDVTKLSRGIDPVGASSALPCLDLSQILNNILLDLTSLVVGIAQGIVASVAAALKNAILVLAQRIGLLKVLSLINQAAQSIAEIQALLNSLNVRICGYDLLSSGAFQSFNLAAALAINGLNTLTGFVAAPIAGALGTIDAASNAVFANIIAPPAAAVFRSLGGVPSRDNITIANNLPDYYVRRYYEDSDPYPGYIVWHDPTPGSTQLDLYTPRGTEPHYRSATEHIFFRAQDQFVSGLENILINNALNGTILGDIVSSTFSATQVFSSLSALGSRAAAFIGVGVGLGLAVNSLARNLPSLTEDLTTIALPAIANPFATINSTISRRLGEPITRTVTQPAVQSFPSYSIREFSKNQLILANMRANAQAGVGKVI
jgi:hypothetical protein